MNLLSLPDIAGMIILMAVLEWLRRKYRGESVNVWMLGLSFILLEVIAVAVLRNFPSMNHIAHAMALDAYVLAGVTFGWAAREGMVRRQKLLATYLLPSAPLFAITTIYGLGVTSPTPYVVITALSLFIGVAYVAILIPGSSRFRLELAGVHALIWSPMIVMAGTAQLRLLTYWGLTCLYFLVALSFRNRVQRGRIGGLIIVSGFILWALCFLAHPFVRSIPFYFDIDEQLWTMQKFFVIIGMILVLLEEQTRRLEDEAMHDSLTHLPNRRLFSDRLIQAISRADRTGLRAAVFVIDLDNFKQVNDTLGHRAGDVVLVSVGVALQARIRSSDTLARCGGDEFNVIINDLSRASDCDRIAEALRSSVQALELPAGVNAKLSASIGYALYPDNVTTADELCELADVRMYEDKRVSRLGAFLPGMHPDKN